MAVDLGIKNLRYLVFGLTIYDNGCRGGLDSVWNGIREARFQHGDVKDQMDRPHGVRQMQYDRVRTCLANDLNGPRYFSANFLVGRVVQKNRALTKAEEPIGNSGRRDRCFGTRETIGVQNAHAITKEFLP